MTEIGTDYMHTTENVAAEARVEVAPTPVVDDEPVIHQQCSPLNHSQEPSTPPRQFF